ncbi:MAG TPA: hypothetical protein VIV60_11265, partial [Polyangiaceae bacterium]
VPAKSQAQRFDDAVAEPFERPRLVKYTDLEDLLALDPVHDVIAAPLDERFAALERAFATTSARAQATNYDIVLAGRPIRLVFKSPALYERFTPAFAHLKSLPSTPDATICISDSQTAGIVPEIDPETFGDGLGQFSSQFPHAGIRCCYVPDSKALFCFDPTRKQGFFWALALDALQSWDFSSPLRLLLAWWAESLGAQLAHGAAIGTKGGAILLGGPSGVGKSTLTLACLQCGLQILGDDYVWVEPGAPPRVASLYSTARIHRVPLREHFPHLTSRVGHNNGEKSCLYLSDIVRERLTAQLPLRAVAALSYSSRPLPLLQAATPMDVLTALAPSSLLQLSGALPSGLNRLGDIVQQTQTFTFEAGADYRANAEAIATLIANLSASTVPMHPDAKSQQSEPPLCSRTMP